MTLPRRPTTLDGTMHPHRITCAACLSLLDREAWMAAPAAKAGRAAARSSPIPPPSFLPSYSTNVNGNLPSRLPVLRAVRLPARAQGRTGARRRALFWVAADGLFSRLALPSSTGNDQRSSPRSIIRSLAPPSKTGNDRRTSSRSRPISDRRSSGTPPGGWLISLSASLPCPIPSSQLIWSQRSWIAGGRPNLSDLSLWFWALPQLSS
jgi:hypothetical protein